MPIGCIGGNNYKKLHNTLLKKYEENDALFIEAMASFNNMYENCKIIDISINNAKEALKEYKKKYKINS